MSAARKVEESSIAPIRMTDAEFDLISQIVHEHSGIALPRSKRSLLASRLQPVVRSLGLADFTSYYERVLRSPTPDDLGHLIDRIATNYTYFYREQEHFRFLREVALPRACEQAHRRSELDLRIWCAAASTGEEPYTLALELLEHFGDKYRHWRAGLLATDISTTALATAKRGLYTSRQLERVPEIAKRKYFRPVGHETFEVQPAVRREVVLRRLNLQRPTYPFRRPFQIVFCRNVMLYFDEPTRVKLERRLHGAIDEGGHLFISMTEGLATGQQLFEKVQSGVYRKRGAR